MAAGKGKIEVMAWLIAHGADPLEKDPYGYNTMGWAQFFKRTEVVAWLEAKGLQRYSEPLK
jgi:hypothetical protein